MRRRFLRTNNDFLHSVYLDIYPGMPVVIYDSDGKFEFEAKVIKKTNSWRKKEPVPHIIHSETFSLNTISESWVVKIISDDPFQDGKEVVRWIPKLVSCGLIRIKELNENGKNSSDI